MNEFDMNAGEGQGMPGQEGEAAPAAPEEGAPAEEGGEEKGGM